MSTPNQAFARRVTPEIVKAWVEEVVAVTSRPIRTIQELQRAYGELHGKCNLLTPITHPTDIMPLHRVSLSVVMINTAVDAKGNGPECYRGSFHKNGEIALGKVGLLKLMQAAGLSITRPQKVDDRSDQHYSAYSLLVSGRDLRGIWLEIEKTGVCDFRDGSPMLVGGADQVKSARAHIDSRAETKAMEKAIKSFLAVQEKFMPEQAALPFVVPVLVIDPDINHPVDRAFLLNHGSNRERQLYGARPGEGAEEVRQLNTVTPPPVGSDTPDDEPPRETPPPVKETPDSAPPAETLDFDIPAAATEERVVCGCECGCQIELETAQAAGSTNALGVARCKACFPGSAFDFPKHKDVRTLNYQKAPHLKNAEDVRRGLEQARAAKAAGRK